MPVSYLAIQAYFFSLSNQSRLYLFKETVADWL